MSVNKVIVIGNLGANPQVRTLPNSGQNVANFSLATTAQFQGSQRRPAEADRMASRGCVRETRGHLPAVSSQRPPGLRRGTADDPPVRGEGRERHALSDGDRSAANALARESRERQRAQGASVRRYPLLRLINQERAAQAALSSNQQFHFGDYDNGRVCDCHRKDHQST